MHEPLGAITGNNSEVLVIGDVSLAQLDGQRGIASSNIVISIAIATGEMSRQAVVGEIHWCVVGAFRSQNKPTSGLGGPALGQVGAVIRHESGVSSCGRWT